MKVYDYYKLDTAGMCRDYYEAKRKIRRLRERHDEMIDEQTGDPYDPKVRTSPKQDGLEKKVIALEKVADQIRDLEEFIDWFDQHVMKRLGKEDRKLLAAFYESGAPVAALVLEFESAGYSERATYREQKRLNEKIEELVG